MRKGFDLTDRVKDFARSRGATLVGVASIERFSKAPQGHHPKEFLPNVKSVISVGLRINKSSILQLPKSIKEYKMNYDMANMKLNILAWEISRFLEDQGYEALAIPASSPYSLKENSADVSHKHAAVVAGLGSFGINNLVLTPDYGPLIRFITVLANAKLRANRPLNKDICLGEKCLKCVKACPANALEEPQYNASEGWRMDKEKCHEYMHTVSHGDVCGLCIKACPLTNQ